MVIVAYLAAAAELWDNDNYEYADDDAPKHTDDDAPLGRCDNTCSYSVTSMVAMFSDASSFNQDLSSWAVDNLNGMVYMFSDASAFDQDLGWCVENYDGYPSNAFSGTLCESTSCGVVTMFRCPTPAPTYAPTLSSAPTSTPAPTASAAPTASDNTDAAPARHGVASLAAVVATLASLLA